MTLSFRQIKSTGEHSPDILGFEIFLETNRPARRTWSKTETHAILAIRRVRSGPCTTLESSQVNVEGCPGALQKIPAPGRFKHPVSADVVRDFYIKGKNAVKAYRTEWAFKTVSFFNKG